MSKKILVVFGTRPEAIKLCPLVLELQKKNNNFVPIVCVTGQHREMLDQVLEVFEVKPNYDLGIMGKNQTLFDVTTKALIETGKIIFREQPDLVIVQGDTTTTFATALAAFYQKIPIAHVEAGLRTYNKYSPFPEEINRKLTGTMTDIHFAATVSNKNNLLNEGIAGSSIYITGNTVIDALLYVKNKIKIQNKVYPTLSNIDFSKKIILITGHRRENFGVEFENICKAIKKIAENHIDFEIVYPVHLNPNVREPVNRILNGIPNIKLIDPLQYEPFVFLMDKSYFIISDSGGIQEEAPSLGKPILVIRNTTERPESIQSGCAKLVGTSTDNIYNEAFKLINDQNFYNNMAKVKNPYGDGSASEQIVNILSEYLK